MPWQAPANFQQLARRLPVFCCVSLRCVVEYQYQAFAAEYPLCRKSQMKQIA